MNKCSAECSAFTKTGSVGTNDNEYGEIFYHLRTYSSSLIFFIIFNCNRFYVLCTTNDVKNVVTSVWRWNSSDTMHVVLSKSIFELEPPQFSNEFIVGHQPAWIVSLYVTY